MAFQIPTSYLNRTMTVKRPSGPTDADADGIVADLQTISTTAKVRIYRNREFGRGNMEVQGIVGASTHKGIAGPSEDIQTSDVIEDNSSDEEFKVNLADDNPAGYSGSHIGLWLSSSEYA